MRLLYKINNKVNLFLDDIYTKYLRLIKGVKIGKDCRISRKTSFAGIYGSIQIGDNCVIEPHVRLKVASNQGNRDVVINVQSNVFIGYGTIIDACCYIDIGKYSMIGPYVLISDGNHILNKKDVPIASQGGVFKPTIIMNNVWVGCQSQVLKGVSIGSNSIVAANSTVIKDMNENSLIAGLPAEIKKNMFK